MSLFTTDIKQDPISKLNLPFYTELCKHNNSTSRADNPVKLNVRQMYNTQLNINKINKPIQTMVQRVWLV